MIDVIILGAGKPNRGRYPSSLKQISTNQSALDWQINSLKDISVKNIYFLGGYEISRVIKQYPKLKFIVIPDWESCTILETFLNAPFSTRPILVIYSDTLFHKNNIVQLTKTKADVSFGYDSIWKSRFEDRLLDDIQNAETFIGESFGIDIDREVEFTGLFYLNKKTINHLRKSRKNNFGNTTLDLLIKLNNDNFSFEPIDVLGEWSELNSPSDIAHFILGTKAETLDRLRPLLKKSIIGDQICFTAKDWRQNKNIILKDIQNLFSDSKIVIRSSSKNEDGWNASNAGGFESVLNIDSRNKEDIINAIKKVINSYKEFSPSENQVLIQEYIGDIKYSGVVFTCSLETGAPYYRISMDSESTDSVTSGVGKNIRTFVVLKTSNIAKSQNQHIQRILSSVKEIESILHFDKLDIEFALDKNDRMHIFQVRPITVDHADYEVNLEEFEFQLKQNQEKFSLLQNTHSNVSGSKTIFGNMPDWNPAEIIGTKPKPLAFSLYRELITNEIWATQRYEYGYRDLRQLPLLYSFFGQPYVDVRASINSFIPNSLSDDLSKILVESYMDILINNPHYHDKLEFEVVFTIWSPTFFDKAKKRLQPYNVSKKNIKELENSLKSITIDAIHRLKKDTSLISQLKIKREKIINSDLSNIDKIIYLISDCKKYGTLPFAHAARAGFVAKSFLDSFIEVGVMSDDRVNQFMSSIKTVMTSYSSDKTLLNKGIIETENFVKKYGHLRPGTYEINSKAYWEDPEFYFFKNTSHNQSKQKEKFMLSDSEKEKIKEIIEPLKSKDITVESLMIFIYDAIRMREEAKFQFSINLSKALDLCITMGSEYNITREQLAFLEYQDLLSLKLNSIGISEIKNRINIRKKSYLLTSIVELPTLICEKEDFSFFERKQTLPNYITNNCIESQICVLDGDNDSLKKIIGKIVLIPQADPGYDWLFGYDILGLITEFGGANSHMAIRSAEASLPAAIGVGTVLYEKLVKMDRIVLDCQNKKIREID